MSNMPMLKKIRKKKRIEILTALRRSRNDRMQTVHVYALQFSSVFAASSNQIK